MVTSMIENIRDYQKKIREMVSERLDLTRNVSDDDIQAAIAQIVAEESKKKYLSLTEKKRSWKAYLIP